MESQPQNPEFRNNPENFHPCLTKKIFEYSINFSSLIKFTGVFLCITYHSSKVFG